MLRKWAARKSYLPALPPALGLIEAIAFIAIVRRQKLDTKNRIALILLDSNFEIALKEYIIHTNGLKLGGKTLETLFKNRDDVIKVVHQKVVLGATRLSKIKHYYGMRNKLIHEKATIDVTDTDIDNYLETVEESLSLLFGLSF